jgi:solute carrier family 35 protein E1
MLACTFDMSASNALGLFCAFGSTIVFVSQNIFFKKIMPPPNESEPRSTHASHKLDKINMLFYSSLMALVLMVPIWIYSDLPVFLSASPSHLHPTKGHTTAAHPQSVPTNFFLNGIVHFAQSILAFILLSSTSPVTYSIASLIKRVTVICIAIMWFKQRVHFVQAVGIVLTFFGLWMYNSAKNDGSVERGERKRGRLEKAVDGRLPTTMMDDATMDLQATQPAITSGATSTTGAYSRPKTSTLGVGGPPRSLPLHTHHPPHNLHITIIPSMASKLAPHSSPKDSYPSPPSSLGSPTGNAPPVHLGTPTAVLRS